MESKALSICVAVLLLPLMAAQVPPEGDGFYVHFDFGDSLDANHPLPVLWYGHDGLTVTTTTWIRGEGDYALGDARNSMTIQVDCSLLPEVFEAFCATEANPQDFKVNPSTTVDGGLGINIHTFTIEQLDGLVVAGSPGAIVHIWSHPNEGDYASSQYFTHANAVGASDPAAADAASDAGGWQPVLLMRAATAEEATRCAPGKICDVWDGMIHVIEPQNTAVGLAGETLVAPKDGYFEILQRSAYDNSGDTAGIAFRDLTNGNYPWTSMAIGSVVVPNSSEPSPHGWFSLGIGDHKPYVERIAQDNGDILWRVQEDRLFEMIGHGESAAGPAYIQSHIFYKPREAEGGQHSGSSGDRIGYDMDNAQECADLETNGDGVNGKATPVLCPYSTGHYSRIKNAVVGVGPDRETVGLPDFGAAEVADLMDASFHDGVVFVRALPEGDGFVGHIEVAGAVPVDQGLVLTYGPGDDVTVHVTPYASGPDGYTLDADHAYYLRMFYLDEDGNTQRVPSENGDQRFWATQADGGRYTFTFPADELPDSPIGTQGLNVQVHRAPKGGGDVDATSQLFLPKEAALAAGREAGAAAADATEVGAFTPLFVVPSGDGSYAVIEPLNALRTEAGTMMEANLRGNYVFEVCLKDAQGEGKAIGDYRFEMVGISDADAPAAPHAVFSVGSMDAVDRELPSAGEQTCIFVDIPRSAVGGSLLYDQFYHVRFVTEGATSAYSEQTNDFDALGQASAAHEADGAAPTGVLLVPRNGSPSQGVHTIGGLLGGSA